MTVQTKNVMSRRFLRLVKSESHPEVLWDVTKLRWNGEMGKFLVFHQVGLPDTAYIYLRRILFGNSDPNLRLIPSRNACLSW